MQLLQWGELIVTVSKGRKVVVRGMQSYYEGKARERTEAESLSTIPNTVLHRTCIHNSEVFPSLIVN